MNRIHPVHHEEYILFTLEQIKSHLNLYQDRVESNDTLATEDQPTHSSPNDEHVQSVLKILLENMQESQDFKLITKADIFNYAKSQKLVELTEYEKEAKINPQISLPSKESEFRNQSVQLAKCTNELENEDSLFKKNQLLVQMLSKYLKNDILPAAKKSFQERQTQRLEKERQLEEERIERERMQKERELKRLQMQRQRTGQVQETDPEVTSEIENDVSSVNSHEVSINEEPYPEPTVYICLLDFPEDILQVRHILNEDINFDCMIGLIAKSRSGPPPRNEEEVEPQVDKNPKGKAPPPKKKDASSNSALPPRSVSLYNQMQAAQFHTQKANISCHLRNPVFVPLTLYTYEYADDMQEFNTGNDFEFEGKRIFLSLEENLRKVAQNHRNYYNNHIKLPTLVPKFSTCNVSMEYYNSLLRPVPTERASVPVILFCMLEQVVKNVENEGMEEVDDFIADDKKVENDISAIEDTLDSLLFSFENSSSIELQVDSEVQNSELDSPAQPNLRRPSHLSVGMSNPPSYEPRDFDSSRNLIRSNLLQEEDHPPIIEYGDKLSLFKNDGNIQGRSLFSIEMEMLIKLSIFPQMNQFDIEPINNDIPNVTTPSERGARLVELHNFISKDTNESPRQSLSPGIPVQKYRYSSKQLQKELILFRFENILKQFLRKNNRSEEVSFSDRVYQEDFSHDTFIQVLSRFASHLGNSVSIHSKIQLLSAYYDLEDSALILYWQDIDRNGTKFDTNSTFKKKFEIPEYYGEFQQENQLQFVKDASKNYDTIVENVHNDIHQKRLQAKLEADAKERRKLERRQKALKEKEGHTDKESIHSISEQVENSLPQVTATTEKSSDTSPSNIKFMAPEKSVYLESASNQEYYFEGEHCNIYQDGFQFYPSDGSIVSLYSINTTEEHISTSEALNYHIGCSVLKDGVNFGFKTNTLQYTKESKLVQGYFSATFEDETCLFAAGYNEHQEAHYSVSTKSGLYIRQSFATGEIIQITNPPSNSHYVQSDYETATKRVYVGAGYKQLLRNALKNMNAFLSRDDEPVQVWNPQRQTVELVLAIEKYRSILPEDRCVVRYMETVVNASEGHETANIVQILNNCGEIVVYHSIYGMWMKTLQDGSRIVYHHNSSDSFKKLDSIQCAMNIDTDTGAHVISREDFVTQVIFQDSGTQMTQFIDGTRIWTCKKPDNQLESSGSLLIEHPRYALVEIALNSNDTTIEVSGTYLARRSSKSLHFTKDGHEFSFISGEEEYVVVKPASKYFQEKHNKVELPPQYGLYVVNYGFTMGGGLKTIDYEGNEFYINWDGKSVLKYRDPLNPTKRENQNDINSVLSSMNFESGKNALKLCVVGNMKNQKKRIPFTNARLFMLRREDGTGCEFSSASQCFSYIDAYRLHEQTEFSEDIDPTQNLTAYTFLTEVRPSPEPILSMKNVILPYSLFPQKFGKNNSKKSIAHFHRRFVKYPDIDSDSILEMKGRYAKWEEWYKSRKIVHQEMVESLNSQTNSMNEVEEKIRNYVQEVVLPGIQGEENEDMNFEEENVEEVHSYDESDQEHIVEKDIFTPLKTSPLTRNVETVLQSSKKVVTDLKSPTNGGYWNSPSGAKILQSLSTEKRADESILDQMYDLHKTMSPKKSQNLTKSFHEVGSASHEISDISNVQDDHSEATSPSQFDEVSFDGHSDSQIQNVNANGRSKQSQHIRTPQKQVRNRSLNQPSNPEQLIIYPPEVKLGEIIPDLILSSTFTITNVGKTPCRFIISYKTSRQNPLSVIYQTGALAAGLARKVVVKLDTNKIPPNSTFESMIEIKYANGLITIPVTAISKQ